jgi:hypothetical protein
MSDLLDNVSEKALKLLSLMSRADKINNFIVNLEIVENISCQ